MAYASEATLLTTAESLAMEYESPASQPFTNYNEEVQENEVMGDGHDLEGSDAFLMTEYSTLYNEKEPLSVSSAKLDKWKSLKNRYRITRIQTNCTRDTFEMNFELNRGFHGLLYAKDFAHECRSRGNDERNVTLRLPTSGCGVRVEMHRNNDDAIELSVRIMLQIEEKLRQSIDILRTVRCKIPLNEMGLSLSINGKESGATTEGANTPLLELRQRSTIR